MQRIAILLTLLSILSACDTSKPKEMTSPAQTYTFLVGTYTDSPEQGINMFQFSPDSDSIAIEMIFEGINNPSFLLANQAGNLVISLEEDTSITGGNLMTFSLSDKKLTPIDTIPSFGDHPCYIGFSPDEQFIVAANYTGGSFSIFKLRASNQLQLLQTIQHIGKSIDESRQEKAHVHSTVFSPDGNYLLVADLGTDMIYTYSFADTEQPASLLSTFETIPGDGPRHVIFSPDGKTLFAVQELTASLEILDFDEGKLRSKQRLSLLADGFTGAVGAAEVRLSADGKHVYVSNRGDANTISVFQKTNAGEFERIQVIPSGGKTPRNFNLTGDGKYLIAAHQGSNDIVVFERNLTTGILSPTNWKVSVNKPVYLFPLKN